MNAAPEVRAIAGVTALLGIDFQPRVVDLHLRQGRIDRIEPPGAACGEHATVLDGSGMIAVPGFIDMHDHLRQLTPGLAAGEGLRLDDLLRMQWAMGQQMGPTEYNLGARLGTLQRLKAGVTTVVDHCYTFHTDGLDEAALDGYAESGIRWVYARGIMTRPFEPVCETWEAAADKARELVARSRRVSPDQFFVAPVSLRQARPEDYRKARDLADELGCGLYTHVSETRAEREAWQTECGNTPIRALDQLGFVTSRTVLVHCVLLEDDEIELLAERGCHVVHCPTNHMKLAKGFTRVPDLLKSSVNVTLGLDGATDMLVEMRTELGMHAAYRLDPKAVSQLEVFRMATHNGALALGHRDNLGVLSPGQTADLVLIFGRSLYQAPMIDPVNALLYGTHTGLIRHVIVGGRLVVRDGRSTLIDEDALLEEAEAVAAAYMRRCGLERQPWFVADDVPARA